VAAGGLVIRGDATRLPLAAACVDAVVTDPPAGISFMGREWDSSRGGRDAWIAWLTQAMREALRVAKPGAHALVWALPRTSHWTATAVEDAGWEIRDMITHLFGQGFPKSLDVGKAIDRAAGAEREVVGTRADFAAKANRERVGVSWADRTLADGSFSHPETVGQVTAPATPEAARWHGWGTSLKPASEHWILARKPLAGTVAANVLAYGTGALNVEACRIGYESGGSLASNPSLRDRIAGGNGGHIFPQPERRYIEPHPAGRWPPNVALSHAPGCQPTGTRKVRTKDKASTRGRGGRVYAGGEGFANSLAETGQGVGYADADGTETVTAWACEEGCPVALLDRQSGELTSGALDRSRITAPNRTYGAAPRTLTGTYAPDQGGASRFFATFAHTDHDSSTIEACQPPGNAPITGASTSAGKSTASSDDSSPTAGLGNRLTAPSLPGMTSTTETTTRSTTTSPTSNASPSLSTSDATAVPGKTTASSTASNTDDASAATPTGPSASSISAEWAPTRATAETASGTTSKSGEQPIATTPTLTCASGAASAQPGSRFFYTAKAAPDERVEVDGISHPTQKPLDLVRWLVRLVTPPGGIVLDPFAGSFTTAEACMLEGVRWVALDKDPVYVRMAAKRTDPYRPRQHRRAPDHPTLFDTERG
jgi:DNA methylase